MQFLFRQQRLAKFEKEWRLVMEEAVASEPVLSFLSNFFWQKRDYIGSDFPSTWSVF